MAVLSVAQKRACAADFKVAHCDFETGAELRIFPDSLEPFCCDFGKLSAAHECKISITAA